MANKNLSHAKNNKNDEFYTQYYDIEKEVNAYLEFNPDAFRGKTILLPCDDPEWSNFTLFFAQRFESLGLKKLISTSYAPDSKYYKYGYQPSLFESDNPKFDISKTNVKGKIFVLDHDITGDGRIDLKDLQWDYLEGDGDFNSKEVRELRNEADIIVTNPPFSLFKEFFSWIMEAGKQFLIIGNVNAITYKEVFPYIMSNKIWLGVTNFNKGMYFFVPDGFTYANTYKFIREIDGKAVNRVPACCWYTNIEHGRRHQPLSLMSGKDNKKFSKDEEFKNTGYVKYENYDAIEVSNIKSIPNDYEGVMGVPLTFIDKYCPEQFEILGMCENLDLYNLKTKIYTSEECKAAYFAKFNKKGIYDLNASGVIIKNGIREKVYQRILIRKI